VLVRTNQQREFSWSVTAEANVAGSAQLRLPYATGQNGAVQAAAWSVNDGAATAQVSISEADVLRRRPVEVELRPAGPRAANAPPRGAIR
jgi:hypothetical protein